MLVELDVIAVISVIIPKVNMIFLCQRIPQKTIECIVCTLFNFKASYELEMITVGTFVIIKSAEKTRSESLVPFSHE